MKTFAAVLVGSSLVALGLDGFIIPYHLMDGGIIGIGLIIKYLFGINVGLSMLFLNLPIYFIAWKYYRHDFFHSLNGFLTSSLLIDLFSPLRNTFHLPIDHSAILGGTLIGLGTGLMLRYRVVQKGSILWRIEFR
ncbi:YitT family protein [Terrilactibacillus sp. S3-3]|nr:YitT family protein [Terrilactibacillus sp. S3-3]